MRKLHTFVTRAYWDNSLESTMNSIREDKDTILDMLTYGSLENAEITIKLSADRAPSYEIKVTKIAEESPFGNTDDEE